MIQVIHSNIAVIISQYLINQDILLSYSHFFSSSRILHPQLNNVQTQQQLIVHVGIGVAVTTSKVTHLS